MIDELIKILRADGHSVADKVFIEGFSAGAMFAQRYCLLHPERVQAIAAGQCGGSLTVPADNYNGTDMDWPVGINDFQYLTGSGFNLNEYQQIPQFIHIGVRILKVAQSIRHLTLVAYSPNHKLIFSMRVLGIAILLGSKINVII